MAKVKYSLPPAVEDDGNKTTKITESVEIADATPEEISRIVRELSVDFDVSVSISVKEPK